MVLERRVCEGLGVALEEQTLQGSWSAPSQAASWDACNGNVASGMVLSALTES